MNATAQRIIDGILADVRRNYPRRDDVSVADIQACDEQIVSAYQTRQRVKVKDTVYGYERTGIVSRTTGWCPALLLMHRSNSHGSSDVLGPADRIVAVWDGRKYVARNRIY